MRLLRCVGRTKSAHLLALTLVLPACNQTLTGNASLPSPPPAAADAPLRRGSADPPQPTSPGGSTGTAAATPARSVSSPAAHPRCSAGLRTPLAVAPAYVATRHTYRYDDLAGYAAAVTAHACTTNAFAARSKPTDDELRRLQTAQEVSSVRVGAVELEAEAPNTATTRFVSVAFTATVSFRGAEYGRPSSHVWTLRLVQAGGRQWRVDAVLSTD